MRVSEDIVSVALCKLIDVRDPQSGSQFNGSELAAPSQYSSRLGQYVQLSNIVDFQTMSCETTTVR